MNVIKMFYFPITNLKTYPKKILYLNQKENICSLTFIYTVVQEG